MNISVIGAGPGGLTLARVLQRHGVAVTVYDRDPGPEARDQGGSLDMQRGTGQTALEAAGLLDAFLAAARPEGQGMRLADRTGEILFDHAARPDEMFNPEIDRGALRGLLLDSLEPGTVHWGHTLERAEPGRLTFREGTVRETDLIVGADGAWSRVRPLLSPVEPVYSGISFVEFRFSGADHPELDALVGGGSLSARGDRQALVCQRNGAGVVRVYAAFAAEPGAVLGRAEVRRRFAGWGAPLRAVIEAGEGFVDRPMYALPVPHTWTHRPGVTLIGDAAHLMSPFSGLGANTAMLDGADLARFLVEDPATAVRRYEELMFPRAAENARGAAAGLASVVREDALEHALTMFRRMSEAVDARLAEGA
jgi:2-polyprenyl-6-methoxyphenol hydroxylase-like FAD-dependent oxidoreductase